MEEAPKIETGNQRKVGQLPNAAEVSTELDKFGMTPEQAARFKEQDTPEYNALNNLRNVQNWISSAPELSSILDGGFSKLNKEEKVKLSRKMADLAGAARAASVQIIETIK